MNILCIDCGNSRLKWGLLDRGRWCGQGAAPLAQTGDLAIKADRIVACNVAGSHGRTAIETLAARMEVKIEWVRSRSRQGGVVNGYEHPEQLGADRWAALVGARRVHAGACLVINAGTATTVDLLAADGRFRGGLILPGLDMMRTALVTNTADLPATPGEVRELPRNTFDAIASGCVDATAGAIERMFARLGDPVGGICLLSGGAAPQLLSHLLVPHRRVDNLVLEGLAAIAES